MEAFNMSEVRRSVVSSHCFLPISLISVLLFYRRFIHSGPNNNADHVDNSPPGTPRADPAPLAIITSFSPALRALLAVIYFYAPLNNDRQ